MEEKSIGKKLLGFVVANKYPLIAVAALLVILAFVFFGNAELKEARTLYAKGEYAEALKALDGVEGSSSEALRKDVENALAKEIVRMIDGGNVSGALKALDESPNFSRARQLRQDAQKACEHVWKVTDEKKAGCTSAGYVANLCEVCGLENKDQVTAKGHTPSQTVVEKPAICTATGVSSSVCTVCGEKYNEVIPVTKHNYVESEKKAACETDGELKNACTICGDSFVTVLPAFGHNWTEKNCTEVQKCKTCGKTQGEATGHDWAPATQYSPATCRNCGLTEGISLGDISVTVEPESGDFYEYDFRDNVENSVHIESVRVETEKSYGSGNYTVTLYFTGKKTFDSEGTGHSAACHVGVKLYDEEGYVIESDALYTPSVVTGEGFRDATEVFYDVAPGVYTVKLMDSGY